jgi:hypothetical protein
MSQGSGIELNTGTAAFLKAPADQGQTPDASNAEHERLKIVADKGDAEAQYKLGCLYATKKSEAAARAYFKNAALHDELSKYAYTCYLALGIGGPKDGPLARINLDQLVSETSGIRPEIVAQLAAIPAADAIAPFESPVFALGELGGAAFGAKHAAPDSEAAGFSKKPVAA